MLVYFYVASFIVIGNFTNVERHLTMAKSIKLTYFDLPGRGELSRMLLAYGGQPWEDNRISFAEWPELKPSKYNIYERMFKCRRTIKLTKQ